MSGAAGFFAAQAVLNDVGGGTPGAWDPADVTMFSGTFTFTNSDATVDNDAGQRGTVRSLTNKSGSGNKRYVEIVIDDYGTFSNLDLAVGFSSTPDAFASNWIDGSNNNFTWQGDGVRNSYGQANTDSSQSAGDLQWTGFPGDVLQMAIEIGVGVTWCGVNGGTLRPSTAAPFTESDVKVFACLGEGVPSGLGDHFMVTILTTAATQNYAAPSGFTPWDD